MESPKRKMQKKNDYQRHKLFRKIKRRRKAQAEAEQQIAEKQLRRKLKLPKFGDGKEKVNLDNAHFDKEGNLVDNTTGIKYIPTSDDVVITPNTKYFMVLRNPSKYSAAMRKKANFAHNASKWNK